MIGVVLPVQMNKVTDADACSFVITSMSEITA